MQASMAMAVNSEWRNIKAASAELKENLGNVEAILVFASIETDWKSLYQVLHVEHPQAILWGGSSYMELVSKAAFRGTITLLGLKKLPPGSGFFSLNAEEVTPEDEETLKSLNLRNQLILMTGSLPYQSLKNPLHGLESLCEYNLLFGGLTSGRYDLGLSHPDFWVNCQIERDGVFENRRHFLHLPMSGLKVGFGYAHGYEPVSPALRITKAVGNRIYEIEGTPVFEWFAQFLDQSRGDDFFELQIQRYCIGILDAEESREQVKLAVRCDREGGSLTYLPEEDLNQKRMRLLLATRRGILDGASQAAKESIDSLNGEKADLVLAISCCTRPKILGSRFQEEAENIQAVLGDTPFFGIYSGGEIMPKPESVARGCGPSDQMASTVLMMAISGVEMKGKPRFYQPIPMSQEELWQSLRESDQALDDFERFLAGLSRVSYEAGEKVRLQSELLELRMALIRRYTPKEVWVQADRSVSAGTQEFFQDKFQGAFLFVDIKGFTAFSEIHDPEVVIEAINRFFDPAAGLILKHHGDVDKFIGDCMFAVFQSPEHAVKAGVAILECWQQLRKQDFPFEVRIGIHAGQAVRGNVGGESRRDYTYIGDAVNLAQRLESNCTPGSLLLSEDAYALCGREFSDVIPREIEVKGKALKIKAMECRVEGCSDTGSA